MDSSKKLPPVGGQKLLKLCRHLKWMVPKANFLLLLRQKQDHLPRGLTSYTYSRFMTSSVLNRFLAVRFFYAETLRNFAKEKEIQIQLIRQIVYCVMVYGCGFVRKFQQNER